MYPFYPQQHIQQHQQFSPWYAHPNQSAPFFPSQFQSAPFFPSQSQSAPFFPSQSQSAPFFPSQFQSAPFFPSQSQSAPFFPSQSQSAPFFPSQFQSAPFFPSQSQSAPLFPSQSQSAPLFPSQSQSAPFFPLQSQSAPFFPYQSQSTPFFPYQSQSAPESSSTMNPGYSNINHDPKTFPDSELIHILNNRTNALKQLHTTDQQQQLPILIDVITVLLRVPRTTLVSSLENDFFSLLRSPLVDLLQQSSSLSSLSDDEYHLFYIIAKLIRRVMKATDDLQLIPSWVIDASLLGAISTCLINIVASETFIQEDIRTRFKLLIRLIDAYILYQQQTDHKDALGQLLDSILYCLTSPHFIHLFTHVSIDARSMTTIEKFFLVKCPAFITSYNGSRLEQTMESLLSTMLPQYVQLLDQLVPSIHQWKRSMMRSVHHLLQVINHGATQFPTNAKLISGHLSLIDNVLRLVNEPILYNNLCETLSNVETTLMNTAISFLVNMIREPSILAHVKQSHMASRFLRLTTCSYEPLVLNAYALLAYTTREEDIKAMHSPGRLFATIINSIKISLKQAPDDTGRREHFLETLKGLIQHDQMKDEVIKQNALPFLLECANKLADRSQLLMLETLWSLTFREESASALRTNDIFMNKIQTISDSSKNEPLKKAADGLVWQLIQKPVHLQKIAEQAAQKENKAEEKLETVVEEVINYKGEKQLVTTVKKVINNDGERTFEYDMMISYCHADKEITYKLHKFLVDQGFKVWIDVEHMYGQVMNAMATAVENSEFVLMCMSDSYKASTYCQAEAEYAFGCKRRLLPLVMRKGYKPDGWLGFMIGSRLYVDFARFDFKIACEKLMTELSHQRKLPRPAKADRIGQHRRPSMTPSQKQEKLNQGQLQIFPYRGQPSAASQLLQTFSVYMKRVALRNFTRKFVIHWTESDVLDFLYAQRFFQMMPLCDGMDGRALIQLYQMCVSQPTKMHALLNDDLKSTYEIKLSVRIYTHFISAMKQQLETRFLPPLPVRPPLPIMAKTGTNVPQIYVPPTTTIQAVVNGAVREYASQSNGPFDVLITSDAPVLDVLKAVTRFAPNYQSISSFLTRHST